MGSERRGRAVHGRLEVNPSGEEPTDRPRQKNAGLWEPYDGRLSRTVLREREGEVPSRHSPGSLHKAPCGGDGTGKSPVDRGKSGWKWSLLTDRNGIPVSWAADGANRNDIVLFEPTVAAAGGLLADVETLHLDRGYDYGAVKACAANHGIDDTASPNSPWPSRCFSPPNSSTGETAGAPNDRLPAHALIRI